TLSSRTQVLGRSAANIEWFTFTSVLDDLILQRIARHERDDPLELRLRWGIQCNAVESDIKAELTEGEVLPDQLRVN
uniref:Uncharacterized protein n=1 Tax=Physcomitrium patens TaxID=3218 RepID=A0A7I3ZJZ8_PHYPA